MYIAVPIEVGSIAPNGLIRAIARCVGSSPIPCIINTANGRITVIELSAELQLIVQFDYFTISHPISFCVISFVKIKQRGYYTCLRQVHNKLYFCICGHSPSSCRVTIFLIRSTSSLSLIVCQPWCIPTVITN